MPLTTDQLEKCPLGCGQYISDRAAHYAGDDCATLVSQFGPVTDEGKRREALRSKWDKPAASETDAIPQPPQVKAAVCREPGCGGPIFKAERCEPHYRANRRDLQRRWLARNPDYNQIYYQLHRATP